MSDLEQNILQPYGEGELVFNQNTVPFDFDGLRLLWLKYSDKDNRDLFIYTFEANKFESVLSLGPNDGMISHVKFLKKVNKVGNRLFYVKDTSEIIMYNLDSKEKKTIGSAPDSIIAFNVSDGSIRENAEDLESGNTNDDDYRVICLDESQTITIFNNKGGK